ncbi:MAG: hypothetical protein Q8N99_03885 [Nanoarchaeota archaeon]|nr:hypothetical protein [Nanoarchaeota archaeon]
MALKKSALNSKKIGFILVLLMTFSIGIISASQCNDGIDNDGDGKIDALTVLDPNNQETFAASNSVDPATLYNFVKSKYPSIGTCPLGGRGNVMLLSKDAPWHTGSCSQLQLNQIDPTMTKICNLAGYKTPYTWDSLYPADGGRCNWFSPGDDCLWYWTGSTFAWKNGDPKFSTRWALKLTCITKIPQCSDGVDNDNDGLIDMNDLGCNSLNDNDERQHDSDCDNTNDDSEYKVACYTNAGCGKDSYTGNKYCQNGNAYQDYVEFICTSPGSAQSRCSSTTTPKLIEDCNYGCSNGVCENSVCDNNGDCDDSNLYTYDECKNPGTPQSYCLNTAIKCAIDNDCGLTGFIGNESCSNDDIFKNFQESKCLNPGAPQSSCKITTIPTFLIDCKEDYCDSYQANYCKGNSVYHFRTCYDNGCSNGRCFSKPNEQETLVKQCSKGCSNGACISECLKDSDCNTGQICTDGQCIQVACSKNSDCGTDSYLGQLFCKDGDSYDRYQINTCNYPATQQSSCIRQTEDSKIADCNFGCSNGLCKPQCTTDSECSQNQICAQNSCVNIICKNDLQCNDNNLNTIDTCINPGTVNSNCNHTLLTVRCSYDSECGTNSYKGQKFCMNNNVFDKYTTYKCNNPGTISSTCTSNATDKLFESCSIRCLNGNCIAECITDNDCKADYSSSSYCIGDNVYKDNFDYSCKIGKCEEKKTPLFIKRCKDSCEDGACVSDDKDDNGHYNPEADDNNYETTPLIVDIKEPLPVISGNIYYSNYSEIDEQVQKIQPSNQVKATSFNYYWLVLLLIIAIIIIIIILAFSRFM